MMMKKFKVQWIPILALCCCVTGTTCRTAAADDQNRLTEAEKKAGWKLLFDGKTTDGWRNYKADSVSDGWEVADGELRRIGKGAGDIVTVEDYGAFELLLDYKISKEGNSGLMFHVTEGNERPWHSGPEIQIQDNAKGHDPQKAGWLYQLYDAPVDATRPAGQWNTLHVRIAPQQSEINMNGVRYARFKVGSADWNKKVAASKFAKFPEFGQAGSGHLCLQDHGDEVAFRNIKIRRLAEPNEVLDPVDGVVAVKPELAFPKLAWKGWEPEDERGRPAPLRPITLTNAGDGTDRVFVGTQRGIIHVFENRSDVESTEIFLDMSDQVVYNDRQNEEGFLGMAFHPDYKQNGEFFVYYSTSETPHTSIVSRFRVSKDDPDKADPEYQEEILRIPQPYWNHNGGTICFGPDGYLYVALGDGGAANDPHENAQNLGVLLGKVLRIDIDAKDEGKNYAVPKDNPFVGKSGALGEIWAYGLRNPWRIEFDRETGTLWEGEVGQNLWEEINLIVKGGNYGWNLREATHTFGANGADARDDLIEPIWEYDHGVGKSITGGFVYRGSKLPQLYGKYLYADYVTGKLWALEYDEELESVVSNLAIPADRTFEVISFGEDENREIYFMVVAANGQGIYKFVSTE